MILGNDSNIFLKIEVLLRNFMFIKTQQTNKKILDLKLIYY